MKEIVLFAVLASACLIHVYSKPHGETWSQCIQETNFQPGPDKMNTTEGKCFLACMMKKKGVVNSSGAIDVEKAKEMIEHLAKHENLTDHIDKYKSMVEECAKEVKPGPTDCDTAYNFRMCEREKAKKMNLEYPGSRKGQKQNS